MKLFMENKMKCRKIEIYDPQEDCYAEIDVSAVFTLAVVASGFNKCQKENEYYGINIGIAIPFKNEEAGEAFFKRYWDPIFRQTGILKIFLIGEDGERIPAKIGEGNLYDPAYESACLFGYIVPEMIASDELPEVKHKEKATFGAYLAQLRK
jgi:hypothetical protein